MKDEVGALVGARKQLIIGVQVVSALISTALVVTGWSPGTPDNEVEAIGGSLTMALFFLAVIAHVSARRGKFPSAPIALLGALGPTYAALGGKLLHIVSYHAFALLAHYLVWANLNKLASSAGGKEPPRE